MKNTVNYLVLLSCLIFLGCSKVEDFINIDKLDLGINIIKDSDLYFYDSIKIISGIQSPMSIKESYNIDFDDGLNDSEILIIQFKKGLKSITKIKNTSVSFRFSSLKSGDKIKVSLENSRKIIEIIR